MEFKGVYPELAKDYQNVQMTIKLNGLDEHQQEIQKYQDCFHGRLFKDADPKREKRKMEWGTKWYRHGERVPKSKWKPLYVRSLPKEIVNTFSTKLFSEEAFPNINVISYSSDIYQNLKPDPDAENRELGLEIAANKKVQALVDHLVKKLFIQSFMDDTFQDGLVTGKVPVVVRVYKGKISFETLDRKWVTVERNSEDPDEILSLTEQYFLQVKDNKTNKTKDYVYRREITKTQWSEWQAEVEEVDVVPEITDDHLLFDPIEHNLGFCPVVVFNSPKEQSIFADEIWENIQGLIEYDNNIKASLKGNLDPQRYLLKEDNQESTPSLDQLDALEDLERDEIMEDDTVWELRGKSVGDFSTSGSHETALKDKDKTANEILEAVQIARLQEKNQQSGVALHQRLANMKSAISRYRTHFGEKGLVELILLLIRIAIRLEELNTPLKLPSRIEVPKFIEDNEFEVTLDWGEAFPLSIEELSALIGLSVEAKESKLVSKDTSRRFVLSYFGVSDTQHEIEKIKEEEAQEQELLMKVANAHYEDALDE